MKHAIKSAQEEISRRNFFPNLFSFALKKKNDLLFSPKLAIYGTSFDKAF